MGRDTVNAIGFTAAVLAKKDPEAVFAVLTADHIIEPQDEFRRKVMLGLAALNVSQIKTPKLSGNPVNVFILAAYTLGITAIYGWKLL